MARSMLTRFAERPPSLKSSLGRANLIARADMTQWQRFIARGAQPGPSDYRMRMIEELENELMKDRNAIYVMNRGEVEWRKNVRPKRVRRSTECSRRAAGKN